MTEQTEQTEPTTCPEAMGMTAVLLAGMRPPLPYPWSGRTARPALDVARSRWDDEDEDDEPEPPDLASLPDRMTTAEARAALGIGLSTFKQRQAAHRIEPVGRRGRSHLWTREQVLRLATRRPRNAAHA